MLRTAAFLVSHLGLRFCAARQHNMNNAPLLSSRCLSSSSSSTGSKKYKSPVTKRLEEEGADLAVVEEVGDGGVHVGAVASRRPSLLTVLMEKKEKEEEQKQHPPRPLAVSPLSLSGLIHVTTRGGTGRSNVIKIKGNEQQREPPRHPSPLRSVASPTQTVPHPRPPSAPFSSKLNSTHVYNAPSSLSGRRRGTTATEKNNNNHNNSNVGTADSHSSSLISEKQKQTKGDNDPQQEAEAGEVLLRAPPPPPPPAGLTPPQQQQPPRDGNGTTTTTTTTCTTATPATSKNDKDRSCGRVAQRHDQHRHRLHLSKPTMQGEVTPTRGHTMVDAPVGVPSAAADTDAATVTSDDTLISNYCSSSSSSTPPPWWWWCRPIPRGMVAAVGTGYQAILLLLLWETLMKALVVKAPVTTALDKNNNKTIYSSKHVTRNNDIRYLLWCLLHHHHSPHLPHSYPQQQQQPRHAMMSQQQNNHDMYYDQNEVGYDDHQEQQQQLQQQQVFEGLKSYHSQLEQLAKDLRWYQYHNAHRSRCAESSSSSSSSFPTPSSSSFCLDVETREDPAADCHPFYNHHNHHHLDDDALQCIDPGSDLIGSRRGIKRSNSISSSIAHCASNQHQQQQQQNHHASKTMPSLFIDITGVADDHRNPVHSNSTTRASSHCSPVNIRSNSSRSHLRRHHHPHLYAVTSLSVRTALSFSTVGDPLSSSSTSTSSSSDSAPDVTLSDQQQQWQQRTSARRSSGNTAVHACHNLWLSELVAADVVGLHSSQAPAPSPSVSAPAATPAVNATTAASSASSSAIDLVAFTVNVVRSFHSLEPTVSQAPAGTAATAAGAGTRRHFRNRRYSAVLAAVAGSRCLDDLDKQTGDGYNDDSTHVNTHHMRSHHGRRALKLSETSPSPSSQSSEVEVASPFGGVSPDLRRAFTYRPLCEYLLAEAAALDRRLCRPATLRDTTLRCTILADTATTATTIKERQTIPVIPPHTSTLTPPLPTPPHQPQRSLCLVLPQAAREAADRCVLRLFRAVFVVAFAPMHLSNRRSQKCIRYSSSEPPRTHDVPPAVSGFTVGGGGGISPFFARLLTRDLLLRRSKVWIGSLLHAAASYHHANQHHTSPSPAVTVSDDGDARIATARAQWAQLQQATVDAIADPARLAVLVFDEHFTFDSSHMASAAATTCIGGGDSATRQSRGSSSAPAGQNSHPPGSSKINLFEVYRAFCWQQPQPQEQRLTRPTDQDPQQSSTKNSNEEANEASVTNEGTADATAAIPERQPTTTLETEAEAEQQQLAAMLSLLDGDHDDPCSTANIGSHVSTCRSSRTPASSSSQHPSSSSSSDVSIPSSPSSDISPFSASFCLVDGRALTAFADDLFDLKKSQIDHITGAGPPPPTDSTNKDATPTTPTAASAGPCGINKAATTTTSLEENNHNSSTHLLVRYVRNHNRMVNQRRRDEEMAAVLRPLTPTASAASCAPSPSSSFSSLDEDRHSYSDDTQAAAAASFLRLPSIFWRFQEQQATTSPQQLQQQQQSFFHRKYYNNNKYGTHINHNSPQVTTTTMFDLKAVGGREKEDKDEAEDDDTRRDQQQADSSSSSPAGAAAVRCTVTPTGLRAVTSDRRWTLINVKVFTKSV